MNTTPISNDTDDEEIEDLSEYLGDLPEVSDDELQQLIHQFADEKVTFSKERAKKAATAGAAARKSGTKVVKTKKKNKRSPYRKTPVTEYPHIQAAMSIIRQTCKNKVPLEVMARAGIILLAQIACLLGKDNDAKVMLFLGEFREENVAKTVFRLQDLIYPEWNRFKPWIEEKLRKQGEARASARLRARTAKAKAKAKAKALKVKK